MKNKLYKKKEKSYINHDATFLKILVTIIMHNIKKYLPLIPILIDHFWNTTLKWDG